VVLPRGVQLVEHEAVARAELGYRPDCCKNML
jgi:hypothetical protein